MKSLIAFFTIPFFFFSFTIIQQNMLDYNVSDDFTLTIKGTSNVHDWESSAEKVSGTADVSFDESGTLQIDKCELSIPVKSIKSSKGSIMDKKTWKALKVDSYSNINYSLISFSNVIKSGNSFTANTKGKLSIAGKTNWISMSIKGKELSNGNIEITGSKDLKMTDFSIDPPTAMLGAMTTGDDITIAFRIVLNQY